MPAQPAIKNALISVSNKLGLTEFARGLVEAGVTLYSTGGTRKHLESEGLPVNDVSHYTGFPEMMDGRLKTLHPKIFGGILCRHDREDDMQGIAEHGIEPFALVVVNLYPFEETIARPGVELPQAIEQIDIGGPSLVRAAAKNFAFTTIACDPAQYADILEAVQT
ncbi:MAG: bifunctional phosphoribosylaminoimidazolecarboxamide formyltransferase/IMP cyclohydrolase, partial [Pirellulaceae bacterium]